MKIVGNVFYTYDTQYGIIIIESNGSAITSIKITGAAKPEGKKTADKLTDKAAGQLGEYFSGKRKVFDIPINPQGTKFQLCVWNALKDIPYGETRSYKEIAIATGNHKACRAVGLANNKNPIWIIIPCHRVIGANGTLTGYGGGLEMKQNLLDLEKINNEAGRNKETI